MDDRRRKVRELRLFEQANETHGLLRYEQLRAAPLSPTEIRHRVEQHRLTRVAPRVFAFGHTALRPEGYWLAALFAHDRAVLSHFSAAAFHGWAIAPPDDDVHITALRDIRRRPGLTPHRTRRLDDVDVFSPDPYRVTHMPRTLVDLADVLDWPAYRRLADGLPTLPLQAVRAAQRRAPNRTGAPLVTRLVEADDAHTRSEFERRFLRFLTARRLPRPDRLNQLVAGHRADAVYDGTKLVVELDGRAFHDRRAQMRADRRRDVDYQLAGYFIVRLVWDDLHDAEAASTAARLREVLER